MFQIVTDAPWELTDEYLNENKIDFIAHDDIPYTSNNSQDIYARFKERGMFVATDRTEGMCVCLPRMIDSTDNKITT